MSSMSATVTFTVRPSKLSKWSRSRTQDQSVMYHRETSRTEPRILLTRRRQAGRTRRELIAQGLAGTSQPRAHRVLGDPQDLRDLGAAEIFPVGEVERDLVVDWNVPQGVAEQALLL